MVLVALAMAARVADSDTIFLPCGFFYLSFFPRLISAAADRTTLTGYVFATKARIDNQKKLVKQQYLLYMSPQYGELRPTSG